MTTRISWADETWNPVTGCSKASPGCDFCYAERGHRRFNKRPFTTVQLHPDRLDKPLRWRKPRIIFVNSTSDLFHPHIPNEYIARVFAVMALTPRHAYPVLTKRHARMASLLANLDFARQVAEEADDLIGHVPTEHSRRIDTDGWRVERTSAGNLSCPPWPLPNVWLGVSAENQHWADIRLPYLMRAPAAVRFVSYEPALGPINLSKYLPRVQIIGNDNRVHYRRPVDAPVVDQFRALVAAGDTRGYRTLPDPDGDPWTHPGPWLDWVIAGGESGPQARPMHPSWAREVRDQSAVSGVAYHFKQWGEWREGSVPPGKASGHQHVIVADGRHEPDHHHSDGVPPSELARARALQKAGTDRACVISRIGRKAAGNDIDGRTWLQFPDCAPDTDCVRAGRAASR